MKPDRSAHYWNSISQTFVLDKQQSLWRSHSDQINISLLGKWMDGRQFDALLKTDLFDEAMSQGLYPLRREHAVAVYGIDVAQESAEKAKMRFAGLKVICADIRNLPCKDHRFDLVVSNSTLDHFHSTDEIDAGLRELFRVLRPGGELHISLDNLQNPIIGLRCLLPYRLLKGLRLVPYFVGKTHGRRGLTKALKRSGFEILETQAIMHCPRLLAVAVAGILQKRASNSSQRRFLTLLEKFECLARLPTRYFTGHFVAVRALRPSPHEPRRN
jgi:SAM-dependent methyltransferase